MFVITVSRLICLSFVIVYGQCQLQKVIVPCNEGIGQCVPINLCANLTDFSDGSGVLDTRFSLDESLECHYLETCCDPENIISDAEGQSFIVESINEKNIDKCIQQCRAVDKPFEQRLPPKLRVADLQPITNVCGYRNKHGVGLEFHKNHDVSQFGEYPWVIALREVTNSVGVYICGGSLIHPSVVLTAAHCVTGRDVKNLNIRAGEWDTQTVNEPFPHVDHTVKRIIIDSDFNRTNLRNDVALLVLESPIKLAPHINTICLPPLNQHFDGLTCFASGWGADTFEKKGEYRVNLKKIKLPIISMRDCQSKLRSTKLGSKFKLHPSFICAGGESGIDTCIGDGGSPLICPVPDEVDYYYQTGIVSWGIECGREGIPGVYVNIAKFRDWIDNEMTHLGYGTKSYTL